MNSCPYNDPELGVYKDTEGINELCMAIMEELGDEKLKGWCLTLLHNRDFWTKMEHRLTIFFKETIPSFVSKISRIIANVGNAIQNTNNFIEFFLK